MGYVGENFSATFLIRPQWTLTNHLWMEAFHSYYKFVVPSFKGVSIIQHKRYQVPYREQQLIMLLHSCIAYLCYAQTHQFHDVR